MPIDKIENFPHQETLASIDKNDEQRMARQEIIEYAKALAHELDGKIEQREALPNRILAMENIIKHAEDTRDAMKNISVKDSNFMSIQFSVEAVKAETQALEMAYKSEVVDSEIIDLLKASLPPEPSENILETFSQLREISIEIARIAQGKLTLANKKNRHRATGAQESENMREECAHSVGIALDEKYKESAQKANQVLNALFDETQNQSRRTEAAIHLYTLFHQALNFGLILDKYLLGYRNPSGGRLNTEERERLLSQIIKDESLKTRIQETYKNLDALESWAESIGYSLDTHQSHDNTETKNLATVQQFFTRHKKPILIGLATLIALGGAASIVHHIQTPDHDSTGTTIVPPNPFKNDSRLTQRQFDLTIKKDAEINGDQNNVWEKTFTYSNKSEEQFLQTLKQTGLHDEHSYIRRAIDSAQKERYNQAKIFASRVAQMIEGTGDSELILQRMLPSIDHEIAYNIKYSMPNELEKQVLKTGKSVDARQIADIIQKTAIKNIESVSLLDEAIAFKKNPVVTKMNMVLAHKYIGLFYYLDLLTDRELNLEESLINSIIFKESDFPSTVNDVSLQAVKKTASELSILQQGEGSAELYEAYMKILRFDLKDAPLIVDGSRNTLKKISACSDRLMFDEGAVDLFRRYIQTLYFETSNFPVQISDDFSNIDKIYNAIEFLKLNDMRPQQPQETDYEYAFRIESLQIRYMKSLQFPRLSVDKNAESVKHCADAIQKTQKAINEHARVIANNIEPLLAQCIDIEPPIPVSKKTVQDAEIIAVLENKYPFRNSIDNLGKNLYSFSENEFPLEWDWNNLSYDKLEKFPTIAKIWLNSLKENSPIKNRLELDLSQPLPERAKKIIKPLFLRDGVDPKYSSPQTKLIQKLSQIFYFKDIQLSAPNLENIFPNQRDGLKKEFKEKYNKLADAARKLDRELDDVFSRMQGGVRYESRNRPRFETMIADQVELPEKIYPRLITEDTCYKVVKNYAHLLELNENIAERYKQSLKLGLPTKVTTENIGSVGLYANLLFVIDEKIGKDYCNYLDLSRVPKIAISMTEQEDVAKEKLFGQKLDQIISYFNSFTLPSSIPVMPPRVDRKNFSFDQFFASKLIQMDQNIAVVSDATIEKNISFLNRCHKIDYRLLPLFIELQTMSAENNLITPENYEHYVEYAKSRDKMFEISEVSIDGLVAPFGLGQANKFTEQAETIEKYLGYGVAQEFRRRFTVDFQNIPSELSTRQQVTELFELFTIADRYQETDEKSGTRLGIARTRFSQTLISDMQCDAALLANFDGEAFENGSSTQAFIELYVKYLALDDKQTQSELDSLSPIESTERLKKMNALVSNLSLSWKYTISPHLLKKFNKNINFQLLVPAFKSINPPVCAKFSDYADYYAELSSIREKVIKYDPESANVIANALAALAEKNDITQWSREILSETSDEINSLRKRLNEASGVSQKNFGDSLLFLITARFAVENPASNLNYKEFLNVGYKFSTLMENTSKDEQGYYKTLCMYLLSTVSKWVAQGEQVPQDARERCIRLFDKLDIPFDPHVSSLSKVMRNIKTQGFVKGLVQSTSQGIGKIPEQLGLGAKIDTFYKQTPEKNYANIDIGDKYQAFDYSIGDKKIGTLVASYKNTGGGRFDYSPNGLTSQYAVTKYKNENPVAIFTGAFASADSKIPDIVFRDGVMESFLISERDGMVIFFPDGTVKIANSDSLRVSELAQSVITTDNRIASPQATNNKYIPETTMRIKENPADFLLFYKIAQMEHLSLFQGNLLIDQGKLTLSGKSSPNEAPRRILVKFSDDSLGVFNFNDSINLLTAAYFLSSTDENGRQKPHGTYPVSPDDAPVIYAVNLDTGGQDLYSIFARSLNGLNEQKIGSAGNVNNVVTLIEK